MCNWPHESCSMFKVVCLPAMPSKIWMDRLATCVCDVRNKDLLAAGPEPSSLSSLIVKSPLSLHPLSMRHLFQTAERICSPQEVDATPLLLHGTRRCLHLPRFTRDLTRGQGAKDENNRAAGSQTRPRPRSALQSATLLIKFTRR